jgi:hypothetical protein
MTKENPKAYRDNNKPGFLTKPQAAETRRKQLTPLRKKIIDHYITTGDGPTATANALNCNRVSVSQALADPYVQEIIQKEIGEKLSLAGVVASNSLVQLAKSGRSEYVKLQASDSILDRIGFKPPERKQHSVQGDIKISIDLG